MSKRATITAAVALLSLSAEAGAWTNTEFYYTPQTPDLSRIVVNNVGYLSPAMQPGLNLMANSFLDVNAGATFAWLSPNTWSGVTWTGLDPVDRSSASQRAAKSATESVPGYGGTMFQGNGTAVGMHLNTYGPAAFPANAQLQSLQYQVQLDRVVWNTSDLLCASGSMNVASAYTSGGVAQAMITLFFDAPPKPNVHPRQAFHVNAMMFDSRPTWVASDLLMMDSDPNNLSWPIVITHLQTQGQDTSVYSSPVPGYGNLLEPFRKGSVSPGNKDRGFCISTTQFARMISDINAKYHLGYTTNASEYVLRHALVGPETSTVGGRGRIGMNVGSFWVYRRR